MSAAQDTLVAAIRRRTEELSDDPRNSSLYTDACKNIERLGNALDAVTRAEEENSLSGPDVKSALAKLLVELRERGLLG